MIAMAFKKKAMMQFQDIIMIVVIFTATIITVGMGSNVMNSLAKNTANLCVTGYAWNETTANCVNTTTGAYAVQGQTNQSMVMNYGMVGNNSFASSMPTLATVLIAAIIISVLLVSFAMVGRR